MLQCVFVCTDTSENVQYEKKTFDWTKMKACTKKDCEKKL